MEELVYSNLFPLAVYLSAFVREISEESYAKSVRIFLDCF